MGEHHRAAAAVDRDPRRRAAFTADQAGSTFECMVNRARLGAVHEPAAADRAAEGTTSSRCGRRRRRDRRGRLEELLHRPHRAGHAHQQPDAGRRHAHEPAVRALRDRAPAARHRRGARVGHTRIRRCVLDGGWSGSVRRATGSRASTGSPTARTCCRRTRSTARATPTRRPRCSPGSWARRRSRRGSTAARRRPRLASRGVRARRRGRRRIPVPPRRRGLGGVPRRR